MPKYKVNILIKKFERIKKRYPKNSNRLDQIVEFAGPKAILDMDKVEGLPDTLTDELWRLALNINKGNFLSYFLQLKEILELPKSKVSSILEVGPGNGIFESLLSNFPYKLTTVDINPDNSPDIVCDILNSPIRNKMFDMVVCFQMLEHLPYKYFSQIIKILSSIAKNYVFISIPYQSNSFSISIRSRLVNRFLSRFSGERNFFLPIRLPVKDIDEQKMMQRKDKHNPHYWEAGRKSFPIERIIEDMKSNGLAILKRFHNPDFPYHYFILSSVEQ